MSVATARDPASGDELRDESVRASEKQGAKVADIRTRYGAPKLC